MSFNKQAKAFSLVVLVVFLFGGCYGRAIYLVGDHFEWSVVSNDTYNDWSASKTFHVGDTIYFRYSYLDHNVMQVKHDEYESCNSTSPLAIYESGRDIITLMTLGHFYFICGFPKHCEFGQKVDINVVPILSPASSPTQSTLSPPIQSPAPTPTKNSDDPSSTTPSSSPSPSPTEKSDVSTSPVISPSPKQAADSEIPDTQSPPKKSAAAVTMSTMHYSMGSLVLAFVAAFLF